MSENDDQERETARVALLRWAESLDSWVQWIVGEVLAAGRPLGDSGVGDWNYTIAAKPKHSSK